MRLLEIINPNHWARKWLSEQNLPEWAVVGITNILDTIAIVLLAFIADFIARKILLSVIGRIVRKSKTKWDDHFYERKVFRSLAHLAPAILVFYALPYVFDEIPNVILVVQKMMKIYIIVLIVIVINKALGAFEDLMLEDDKLVNSPLRTVSQVVRILVFFVALVLMISVLSGIPAANLLGILAGTSAILILIFQDSIVGLLANFQITMYDLLRVGDWVTLEKQGVDGDVLAIDLTTVKVRNFDKTISSVPAKAFVSEAFVNWRGMKEEGARRIKRNILIDINSIHFVGEEDINTYKKVMFVQDYVGKKQDEIEQFNKEKNIDTSVLINGRRQTNIGVYRQYVSKYLHEHKRVDNNFMAMVRQLQPTAQGVPIEVYCFANTTVWGEYEVIQADIFDHLYAATEYFGLRLFQAPTGRDIRSLEASNSNKA